MTTVRRDGYARIEVDGVSIEYRRIAGDERLPTIVLLHEGLGSVALWRDFPDALAALQQHPVFVYSRAGYGGSDPVALPRPLDYMTIEADSFLPSLLQLARIERHILFGHSDGASIALAYAGRSANPNLKKVIAVAPHVFTERVSVEAITAIKRQFQASDLRARLEKYHGANVDCAFHGWCDSWLHPAFLDWSIEDRLRTIKVPLLLVQGEDDEYGTPEQLRRIENRCPTEVTSVLLGDCAHAPQNEQREKTLQAVDKFLGQTVV